MTVKPDQKQLLDRLIIAWAGRDSHAGTKHAKLHIEVGRLRHDVVTRQIVTALLQHFHYSLRDFVTIRVVGVSKVCVGIVFSHPLKKHLHAGVAPGLRFQPRFGPRIRNDAGGLLEALLDRYCEVQPAALGEQIDGATVCWIGGWDGYRVFFVVMVVKECSVGSCSRET